MKDMKAILIPNVDRCLHQVCCICIQFENSLRERCFLIDTKAMSISLTLKVEEDSAAARSQSLLLKFKYLSTDICKLEP